MSLFTRTQLSLFVPVSSGTLLERLRQLLDPVQHGLIAAHVTLCREEDIAVVGMDALRERLRQFQAPAITLRFGPAERFHEHGVLLPCVAGEEDFQALRQQVLGSSQITRRQSPHITLAHPRNAKSPHNDLLNTASLSHGLTITFDTISLIEQTGSSPWIIHEEYPLSSILASSSQ